jgi:TatD DNase family protein
MIDSHAHLNDPRFSDDVAEVVARAEANGVKFVINVGADLESSRRAVEQSEEFSQLYAVVGVHPHDAVTWNEEVEDEIRNLTSHSKVLAIGETGLDYYYDHSPRDVQQSVFRKQLALARELDLPVVIHSRDAAQDTLKILREFPDVPCVLHCYSGSWEMAQEYLKLGHYFSIGGSLTFKNADRLRSVIAQIPLSSMMLETDCPYLTPVPHRGKRNEPGYLPLIAEQLAELHGVSLDKVIATTEHNTRVFFRMNEED